MTKKYEIDQNAFESLDPIAKRYAAKYHGYYGLEFDDIYSELWVYFIEKLDQMAESGKYDDNINNILGIVSKYASGKAIDMVRMASRRSTQIPTDVTTMLPGSKGGNTRMAKESTIDVVHDAFWKSTNISDDYTIVNLLGLFEDGTREHTYIKYMLLELGLVTSIDGMTYEEVFGKVSDEEKKPANDKNPKGETKDMVISHAMGFANSSSSPYKVVKWNVYEKICNELGYENLKAIKA